MSPYTHAIPGPAEIIAELERRGVPQDFRALVAHFGIKGDKQRQALQKQLKKLVRNGRLLLNRKNEYCLIEKIDALTGTVSAHRDGFGFLLRDDGGDDVFYAAARNAAVAGWRPRGRAPRRHGPQGQTQGCAGRNPGAWQDHGGRAFRARARPDLRGRDRDPFPASLPRGARDTAGAKDGQMVKVEIVAYPTARREAQARVQRVLGHPDDPGMLVTLAIESFGLRDRWPRKVRDAAKAGAAVVCPPVTSRAGAICGICRW